MRTTHLLAAACTALLSSACLLDTGEPDTSFIADYQFGVGQTASGWAAGAVDFPAAEEGDVGFVGDVRVRPEETLDLAPALYLQGANVSGDLFMYWYRMIDGFVPNAEYTIGVDIEYSSRFGRDCTTGAGPTTWIKAGAVGVEPSRSVDQSGNYRLNVDKGQHATGGATVLSLGDLRTNAPGCIVNGPYSVWGRHSGQDALRVRASAAGQLWLIFGIESTAAGTLTMYINRFGVRFRPVS
ncbi:MAG: hypothetical protein KJZ47_05510 [Gemmatimonadales bacterium]|nr:hypothetical protein [Gemmatimonadales bacterium]